MAKVYTTALNEKLSTDVAVHVDMYTEEGFCQSVESHTRDTTARTKIINAAVKKKQKLRQPYFPFRLFKPMRPKHDW